MIVGVVKETFPGERRVALVPSAVAALKRGDVETVIEAGAGAPAGFPDDEYVEVGARILNDRAEVFSAADVLCQVRTIGANPDHGAADLDLLRSSGDLWVIGLAEPLSSLDPIKALAETGQSSFALELIPRITRAQSMDVLSSQATIAWY